MLFLKSIDLKKEKIDTLVIPVCEDKDIHDNRTITSLIKKIKYTLIKDGAPAVILKGFRIVVSKLLHCEADFYLG